jgi:hypothetical protein
MQLYTEDYLDIFAQVATDMGIDLSHIEFAHAKPIYPEWSGRRQHTSVFIWQDGIHFTFAIEGVDVIYRFKSAVDKGKPLNKSTAAIVAGLVIMWFVFDLGYRSVILYTNDIGPDSLAYQLGSGRVGSFARRKKQKWKTKDGKNLKDAPFLCEADRIMSKFEYFDVISTLIDEPRELHLVTKWNILFR